MRVWVDVYAANSLQKVGAGINLTSASVTRTLDGAGAVSITFPAADENFFDLAQLERRLRIYVEQDEKVRLFGSGIIRERTITDDPGGAKLTVSGPDSLDALTRKSVLLRRKFENQTIGDIASALTALAPPWSIFVNSSILQTVRFDGVSVFKALVNIAQKGGLHIREGETPDTLEMAAFGYDSGIKALHPSTLSVELYGQDDILLIDKISQKSVSRDVVNWIIPLGAGEGDAAVTMEGAINVTPGQMTGPDGKPLYYLQDVDSIATYGQIEAVVVFKDIVPTSNSNAVKAYTAEQIYAAGQAWLERNAWPLTCYTVSAKKCRTPLRAGDKIRMMYKGVIEVDGGQHTYLNVNELFWVMEITETASDSGLGVALKIANVDRRDRDLVEWIGEGLEAIEVRNLAPQTHTQRIYKENVEPIWGSTSADSHYAIAKFTLDVDEGVTDVVKVLLHFISEPGYTMAGVTTSGTWDGDLFANFTRAPNYPQNVRLLINGGDVSSAFGGPWGTVSASTGDIEIDVTDYVREASGGIYRIHTFEFTCDNVSGERSYPPHTTSVGDGQSGGLIRCEIKAQLTVKD